MPLEKTPQSQPLNQSQSVSPLGQPARLDADIFKLEEGSSPKDVIQKTLARINAQRAVTTAPAQVPASQEVAPTAPAAPTPPATPEKIEPKVAEVSTISSQDGASGADTSQPAPRGISDQSAPEAPSSDDNSVAENF